MTSSDLAYSTLLERLLAPGSGAAAIPSATELADQLATDNPQLAILAKVLAQREAALSQAVDRIDAEPAQDDEPPVPAARRVPTDALADLLDALYRELEQLRRRNDMLAAALGACYLCWGEDRHCPACHGQGRPRSASPDADAYAHLVAPAADHIKRESRRSAAAIGAPLDERSNG
jgi:hypothetical protein